jgi:multidrug efflux pump subunit AcrB
MPQCRVPDQPAPDSAEIQTHRMDFSNQAPIIGYSLTPTKFRRQLWEIATYEIKPRLNRLNGVGSILVQGGQEPEFHIMVDPARMLRTQVSVMDILNAVNRTNIIDSPGLLTQKHQLFLGLVTGQARGPEDIGSIVIKNVNNAPVRVDDIGKVEHGIAPVYTTVTANGRRAVLVSVSRQPEKYCCSCGRSAPRKCRAYASSCG